MFSTIVRTAKISKFSLLTKYLDICATKKSKMTSVKWMVVVNPNAGHGKGKKDWKQISSYLNKYNIDYQYCFTQYPFHAIELTGEAISNGFRNFIGVGGDGTMNEIVNGIFGQQDVPTTDITIATITVGTGNDWGRMFDIPAGYEESVRIISEGKTTIHDAGLCIYHRGEKEERRFFINIAGLGFDAMVVKLTNRQKERGRKGKAIYMWNLLMSLIVYRHIHTDVEIDNNKVSNQTFTISIGIGKYSGGGMMQTPRALHDDGLFDITIIKSIPKGEVIRNLKRLYDGSIYDHPKIEWYRGKTIRINSDTEIYAEADGESLGHSPIDFCILPKCINVIISSYPSL
jgi:YegS/Rv2252/BmrU family lipid kinase